MRVNQSINQSIDLTIDSIHDDSFDQLINRTSRHAIDPRHPHTLSVKSHSQTEKFATTIYNDTINHQVVIKTVWQEKGNEKDNLWRYLREMHRLWISTITAYINSMLDWLLEQSPGRGCLQRFPNSELCSFGASSKIKYANQLEKSNMLRENKTAKWSQSINQPVKQSLKLYCVTIIIQVYLHAGFSMIQPETSINTQQLTVYVPDGD